MDGESIAIHNLTKALAQHSCQITLLCLNTSKHKFELESLPDHVDQYKKIYSIDVKTEVTAKGALKNLLSKESYHISRFFSSEFNSKLEEILSKESFDIIQLETLTMAVYLPQIKRQTNAPVVMRAHNVEHQIWSRLSENIGSPIRKLYIKYLTKKLKRFELAQLGKYDLLLTVSKNDLDLYKEFGYTAASQIVPIGIDISSYPFSGQGLRSDLFFIGSMDWMPNAYGLSWFIKNVWPEIQSTSADIELHVAGRNSQKLESIPGMTNHGEVESALSFMQDHGIMIVPLFSGSGTRVKIIEGLALGKVIISTNIGAEGIDLIEGEHILFANTKEEFVEAIKTCIDAPEKMKRIAKNARKFIEENYDAKRIAKTVVTQYQKIIKRQ